jgi:putative PIN family toxin of toxin-antitoxin system
MIKAVLDSNIYISAFFFDGLQRKLLRYAAEGIYLPFISLEILQEIEAVLDRPKFNLQAETIKIFISELQSLCELAVPSVRIKELCRDADDHIILECAAAAEASYIVSGDKDLLVMKTFNNTEIVDSRAFIELLGVNEGE